MSKLLKKVVDRHMPHLSSRLTKENGYDETKHLTAGDLHKAKLISDKEKAVIDDCIDTLDALNDSSTGNNLAKALTAADTGEVSKDKLNDDAFIAALMNDDLPGEDGADDNADSDEDIVA